MHWAVCGWMDRAERQGDGWLGDKHGVNRTHFVLTHTHTHIAHPLALFFLNCFVRSHTETCPYIELEETQTVEQCRWLQSYKWGHWARLSFRRDKHGGGSKSIWKPPSTTGWTDATFGDTWKGRQILFLKSHQILFEHRPEFIGDSGIMGSAQRGLITCHGLAQYPDLFVGASMGPAGGRAVRTCLWAATTFNTKHHC